MSTEARYACIHAIWRYQNSLTVARGHVLDRISDAEHFRFVTMIPLPLAGVEEAEALAQPVEEVLYEMRNAGIGSGGWDASDESSSGDETDEDSLYSSESSDGMNSWEREVVGEEMEMETVYPADDVREDHDSHLEAYMADGEEGPGAETYESDYWSGYAASTVPSSPEEGPLFFTNLKDVNPAELEPPISPASRTYSDPSPDSSRENSPTSPEDEHDYSQYYQDNTFPAFILEVLNKPTTAESLFALEEAYHAVSRAYDCVRKSIEVLGERGYDRFSMGYNRKREAIRMRRGSKLKVEVFVEDLEWEWGWGPAGSSQW